MRKRNLRLVYTGLGMLVLCAAFFLGMTTLIPKSNDPVALMQTVGQVSGVVGAIAIVMIIIGMIGRKTT